MTLKERSRFSQNKRPQTSSTESPAKYLKTGDDGLRPLESLSPPVIAFESEAHEEENTNEYIHEETCPTTIEEETPQRRRSSVTGTYTSSIYVDAFNLALDTVLSDESYLFSDDEAEVFAKFRSLDYEAQHLYVRLFLRKTASWFRIERLKYQNDIADLDSACTVLQDANIGFADKDVDITIEEAAGLLSLGELKLMAKEAKCAVNGAANKAQLIEGLKRVCNGQGGLQQTCGGQLKLSFDPKGNYVNRTGRFVRKILDKIGPCIRLSNHVVVLFNRVHLVFYRSTEWSEKSLTTIILSRTQRRNFPGYVVSRTANIFPTRQSLLDFEAAIKQQSEVDELLETSGVPTDSTLRRVREIFDSVYPLWQSLVEQESEKTRSAPPDEALERIYLRRFDAAWVYTRIVHKGLYVLGRSKEYELEHTVLSALLAQKLFHSARRGVWYQRKALIEENYMAGLSSPKSGSTAKQKDQRELKKWRQIALATCEAGLQDAGTHVIYHHELQKRILKLEARLHIPKRERHDFGHARLLKSSEHTIYGTRINTPSPGRKTLWIDPAVDRGDSDVEGGSEDNGVIEGCSVEEMVLSIYRSAGWKGYHTENGLLRTLFAYLFFDILFLPVPNVFETAYQTAPLDLFTDAFFVTRASEINHRLVEIANGAAAELVKRVWEEHGTERRTSVVGLDWSFAIEDLLEIVDASCFQPQALSDVCKVLAQEYRQRGSGFPDLFLWKPGDGCMFVEVKSENDRLSDTQRLWIHVLSSAGVRVELCADRKSVV